AAVLGLDGPAVVHFAHFAAAGIDHGFDREDHACFQSFQRAGFAVVKDLGLLMENLANAVSAEFTDDAVTGFFGMLLDRMADIPEVSAGLDLGNAQPHAFIGDVAQPLALDGRLAYKEHAAGVAMVAIL